jgi:GNAT superfamily N-acetyltransferase
MSGGYVKSERCLPAARIGNKERGGKRLLRLTENEGHSLTYPQLLTARDACLLLAVDGEQCPGYLLGFRHLTFYANGPVGWVEEVLVRSEQRGAGLGRALMSAFERWAAEQGCGLVALATRRAAVLSRLGL